MDGLTEPEPTLSRVDAQALSPTVRSGNSEYQDNLEAKV